MFDTMTIKNSFMRGILSKVITRMIRKNGINLDIDLNGLEIVFKDDKARIHLELDGEMSKDDLIKLINDKL